MGRKENYLAEPIETSAPAGTASLSAPSLLPDTSIPRRACATVSGGRSCLTASSSAYYAQRMPQCLPAGSKPFPSCGERTEGHRGRSSVPHQPDCATGESPIADGHDERSSSANANFDDGCKFRTFCADATEATIAAAIRHRISG